jgi:predicted permease
MLLLLVLTPILFFSFKQKLEFNFDIIVTITMIFYTLTAFLKAYILLKIIYHYSSQSVSFLIISQSFGGFISRFVKITKEEKESNEYKYFLIILEFIGILIALFATLVYDEIIINK